MHWQHIWFAFEQGRPASDKNYSESVQVAVREVLGEIKDNSASTPKPWIDIWAHFGQVLIHGVDEGNFIKQILF